MNSLVLKNLVFLLLLINVINLYSQQSVEKRGTFIVYEIQSRFSEDNFDSKTLLFHVDSDTSDNIIEEYVNFINSDSVLRIINDKYSKEKVYVDYFSFAQYYYYNTKKKEISDSEVMNNVNNRDSIFRSISNNNNNNNNRQFIVINKDSINYPKVYEYRINISLIYGVAKMIKYYPIKNGFGFNYFYWDDINKIYNYKNYSAEENVNILLSLQILK